MSLRVRFLHIGHNFASPTLDITHALALYAVSGLFRGCETRRTRLWPAIQLEVSNIRVLVWRGDVMNEQIQRTLGWVLCKFGLHSKPENKYGKVHAYCFRCNPDWDRSKP